MKDKLVTLIGGGGFVGRYVAQALLKAGARVRVAERDPRRAWFLKPLGGLGQTQFVAADVRKPETIVRAVQGADAVVNLVGTLAGDFDGINAAGAKNVAEACAAAGVPALVHVSAIGADAESEARYARTKGEGEAAVRAAFPNATIVRPSLVFGREDRFTNRFAEMITRAGERFAGRDAVPDGVEAVLSAARSALDGAAKADPPLHEDYLVLADPATFDPVEPGHRGPAVLAVAARVGATRLIDNLPLEF